MAAIEKTAAFMLDFASDPSVLARTGQLPSATTRATIATIYDQDGMVRECLSGEMRMNGMRRVRNLLTFTEDFNNAAWQKINGGAGSAPTVTSGFTAPDGTATAWRLQANSGGIAGADYSILRQNLTVGAIINGQRTCFIKSNTGVNQTIYFASSSGTDSVTVTTNWQRMSRFSAGSSGVFDIGAYPLGSGNTTTLVDVLIWHPQCENVTGQTNQNPGPYVSVGVLSTPFHGAGVDGVLNLPTLNGNTVASNVVTEATGAPIIGNSSFGALPGASGAYFSTPDSAAASITGDIDIRVKVALNDVTPATSQVLFSKYNGAQSSYLLLLETTNNLRFFGSADGSTNTDAGLPSTVALSTAVSDGQVIWIRVTKNTVNGEIKYYTSADGVSWSQLGATVAGAIYNFFNGNASVEIGTYASGTASPSAGKFYRAQIYNGINGTLAVDFNPNSWASGGTWVSATGETWTINGAADVVTAPQPGFLPELAATDLLLARADARDMTTANWALGATMTRARTSVGWDGVANTATRLTGGAVAATNRITMTFALAAASRTYSVGIRRVTGTGAILISQDNFATSTDISGLINSSTFTLVQIVANQLNPVIGIQVSTNADAIDADWNQYEAGDLTGKTNSRIPTTITTRNADVLTYSTTGWLNAAASTLYGENLQASGSSSGVFVVASLDDGTSSERCMLYANTATVSQFLVTDGGVTQAALSAAVTGGAITKAVGIYQVNDFAGFANNTSMGTDVAGTLPTVTQLCVGHQAGGSQLGTPIRKIAYYAFRMESTKAQGLTV